MQQTIDELLNQSPPTLTAARHALERLRRGVEAPNAALWILDGTTARRALRAGRPQDDDPAPVLELTGRMLPVERLRRNRTLFCRFGEASGVEALVPGHVKAFAVAAATRRNMVSSVLVLGWDGDVPSARVSFAHLPTAAALLERAATPPLRATDHWVDAVLHWLHSRDRVTRGNAVVREEPTRDDIAAKLLAAQEAERSRIARDLHDDLGQQVMLLEVSMAAALRRPWSPRQARSALLSARTKLQEIATSIHTLAHTLHPAKLRLLGLVPTLQALCRDIAAESGQEVRFVADDVPADVDEGIVLCLFRVAQEALRNAVKHSGARAIDVHLIAAAGLLTLRVADNGCGFDPVARQSAGLGLMTMRERVELVNGQLTIETGPSRGTLVEATISHTPHPLGSDAA